MKDVRPKKSLLNAKKLLFILFILFLFQACFKKQTIKRPPDFSKDQREISQLISEMKATSISVNEEFHLLLTNMNAIADLEKIHCREDFPMTTFKHVLMACLNTNHKEEKNPEFETYARTFGVTCEVLPLRGLFETLSTAENLSVAQRGLQSLDGVRHQRFKIQKMLQSIPDQILRIRKEINVKKGELRRRKAILRRKRNEYSSTEWANAQDAINAYDTQLNDAWTSTKTLTLNQKIWHQKLGTEIETLYKEISVLGEADVQ